MKKKNDLRNYLEFIPERSEFLTWNTDEKGIVTLDVENKGVFNTIAQTLFKKPRVSHIHLDELGSFVWPLIDGKTDITALGVLVKEEFGEKAEPLYPRLAKFFQVLESYHFIKLNK
ncbi:MAG: PqqD family protein [Clostridiaceae bacterium]|nr:PqqD family protein [Clostridiaceae bacterium]